MARLKHFLPAMPSECSLLAIQAYRRMADPEDT